MIKYCYKCQQTKPLDDFPKNKSKKDGLATECKPCKRLLDKIYFEKNTEKIRANVAKYRELNKEKSKEAIKKSMLKKEEKYKQLKKQWRELNAEKMRFYKQKYKKSNLSKVRESSASYRSFKLNAIPSWIDKTKISCLYSVANMLNKYGTEKYHVDHIVPLRHKLVCGLHTYENLMVIPAKQNLQKSNKFSV